MKGEDFAGQGGAKSRWRGPGRQGYFERRECEVRRKRYQLKRSTAGPFL